MRCQSDISISPFFIFYVCTMVRYRVMPCLCTNCQQGGLLQLGSSRHLWPAARPVVVRLERRRPCAFLSEAVKRITPLLRELDWLRVPEQVTFRLCVLAYRWLHGTAPTYMYLAGSLLRTSNVDTRPRLGLCALLTRPCWWYRPPYHTIRSTLGDHAFPWLRHVRGTACRRLSGMHRR